MSLKQKFNPLIKKRFNQVDKELATDGNFVPILGTIKNVYIASTSSITSISVTVNTGDKRRLNIVGTGFTASLGVSFGDILELRGVTNETQFNRIRYEVLSASDTAIEIRTIDTFIGDLEGIFELRKPAILFGQPGSGTITLSGTQSAGVATLSSGVWVDNGLVVGKKFKFSSSYSNISTNGHLMICTITSFTTTVINFTSDKTFITGANGIVSNNHSEIEATPIEKNIHFKEHPDDLDDYDDFTVIDRHILNEGLDLQIPLKGTLTINLIDYPIISLQINVAPEIQIIATDIDAELPSLIGKTITISGAPANFNGDYVITVDDAGIDTFLADRVDAFSTTSPSYATSVGNAAVPNTVDVPVTGVVNFTAQPDTLPGFDTLSTITQGILVAAITLPNGTVNTVDATVTIVDTINDLTDDSSHLIDVSISTEQDTNAGGGVWTKRLFVTKRGGTVVIQQIEDMFFSSDAVPPLLGNSITFVVNAGNIDIKVKGIAAKNYKWNSKYEIIQKTTN